MPTTIDSLQIQIESNAKNAQSGIDALSASLDKLAQATRGGAGLSALNKKLDALSATINKVSASANRLKELSDALGSLKAVENIKIPGRIGSQLTRLVAAINAINSSGFERITELSNALASLANLKDVRISSNLATQLSKLGEAAKSLSGVDLSVFGNLAETLHPLSEIGDISNFISVLNRLKKLPDIMNNLNAGDVAEFAQKVQQLTAALAPLATQMNSISSAFANFPSHVQQTAQRIGTVAQTNRQTANSYMNLWSAIQLAWHSMRGIGNTIMEWIQSSNEYIEDVNLFTASLGQYAQQAQAYAEKVGEIVGIDPGEWMKAQGVFYNLADGFGIASDRAYTMSQQLTQLSYDLASFYNLRVEDAMLKLRGALSGEIEMMRQLGVDLSNAAMQERANAMGIQTKVTAMTQAEKAQLRYLIMMERTTTAQGDMARTLDTPANQLRVLSAQATQAARALGNVFVPVLNLILPIAIAVAKAIRMVAAAIASLFGYSLPEIDYSGIGEGLNNAAGGAGKLDDNLGGAADKAKKLKSYLMGFDELNVINPDDNDSSSGGSGSGGGGGGGGFDWDLPTYDFLGDLIESRIDAVFQKIKPFFEWVSEHVGEILAAVGAIGAELLMWKLAKTFLPDLSMGLSLANNLKAVLLGLAMGALTIVLDVTLNDAYLETGDIGYLIASELASGLGSFMTGRIVASQFGKQWGITATGFTMAIGGAISLLKTWKYIDDGGNLKSIILSTVAKGLQTAIGVAVAATGLGFGTSAALASAAFTIGVVAAVTLTKVLWRGAIKGAKWGDVTLKGDEITKYAESLLTKDVTASISLANVKVTNVDNAKAALEESITTIETNLRLVQLGVDLEPDAATKLVNAITGTDGLIAKVQQQIGAQIEVAEVAVSLAPPKDSEGNSLDADGMLKALGLSGDLIQNKVTELGNKLADLLTDGMKDGLSAEEKSTVQYCLEMLDRISSAVAKGQRKADFQSGLLYTLNDLDKKSFTKVMDEVKSSIEEYQDGIRRTWEESQNAANAHIFALQEIAAQALMNNDEKTYREAQASIEKLQAEFANVDIESTVRIQTHTELAESGSIDYFVSQMREKFSDVMAQFADDFSVAEAMESIVGDFKKTLYDESLETGETMKTWIQNTLHAIDSSGTLLDMSNVFQISGWEYLTDEIRQGMYNVLSDALGTNGAAVEMAAAGIDISDIVEFTGWDTLESETKQQLYDTMKSFYGIDYTALDMASAGINVEEIIKFTGWDTLETSTQAQLYETMVNAFGAEETRAKLQELGIELPQNFADGIEEGSSNVDAAVTQAGVDMGESYGLGVSSGAEGGAQEAVEKVTTELDKIPGASEDAYNEVTTGADNASSTVKGDFDATFTELSSSATTSFGEINTSAQTAIGELATWVKTNVTTPIAQDFGTLATNIQTALTAVKTNVQTAWNELPGWVTSSIKTPISTTFSLLQTEIETGMTTAKTNVQTTWAQVSTWFSSNVVQPMIALFKAGTTEINSSFSTMSNDIVTSMNTMSTKVSAAFTTAKNSAQKAWNDMPSYMSGIASRMANSLTDAGWYSAGQSAAWQFKSGFESIQIQANVQSSSKSTSRSVSAYASGGFPSTGQLFVAREAGAEMVGSIRGRTAVANNDQIVAGVSEGVYEAVTAALAENAGNQNITINLDGKVIYQNQQKVAKTVGYQFAH